MPELLKELLKIEKAFILIHKQEFEESLKILNSIDKNENSISDYLPIQIEESERLIPVEKNMSTTFWGNDFYEDNFPFLILCPDFNRQAYTIHSNESYDFVDKISLNEDLVKARLCAIQLLDTSNTNN